MSAKILSQIRRGPLCFMTSTLTAYLTPEHIYTGHFFTARSFAFDVFCWLMIEQKIYAIWHGFGGTMGFQRKQIHDRLSICLQFWVQRRAIFRVWVTKSKLKMWIQEEPLEMSLCVCFAQHIRDQNLYSQHENNEGLVLVNYSSEFSKNHCTDIYVGVLHNR